MSEQELVNEFNAELRMYGYLRNNKLIASDRDSGSKRCYSYKARLYFNFLPGQEEREVTLLKYLLKKNQNSRLLVGTWREALHGQFDFMKNLVSFFTQKTNRL